MRLCGCQLGTRNLRLGLRIAFELLQTLRELRTCVLADTEVLHNPCAQLRVGFLWVPRVPGKTRLRSFYGLSVSPARLAVGLRERATTSATTGSAMRRRPA